MGKKIDLHTHSYYSDGTSSPSEVVQRAAKKGVELLCLSDHDTTTGLEEAAQEAKKRGMEFIGGIEINTGESDQIHILGYGIDSWNEGLKKRLEDFRQRRLGRIRDILQKLKASGVAIDFEDIQAVSRETLGRPHVADALVRRRIVHTRQEAFQKYLVHGRAGYVEPRGPSTLEAIEVIRESGGVAVLAHPGIIQDGNMNLGKWTEQGLGGIEAYYLSHTAHLRQELLEKAEKFSLVPTGGSDYHGPGTGREEIGGVEVPEEVYERVLAFRR
ncbi:MAG: PHP domain-containing protein [Elusimicrobia bacterium]|nr:PHP domain-containing protein [Elusimicrobiota bacterium]